MCAGSSRRSTGFWEYRIAERHVKEMEMGWKVSNW